MHSRPSPTIFARPSTRANTVATGISSELPPIATPSASEEPNRVDLKQAMERFLSLNNTRLERLFASLNSSQQSFIDLLPLIFHLNNPVLPGYMEKPAPCGIRNYKPTRESIKSARALSNKFALQRDLKPSADICAIYIMGSSGSIAHSDCSDMDIWVCPAQNLETEQRQALTEKCQRVADWCQSNAINAHFFVMDDLEFRQHKRAPLQGEDCGSSQHFLLLDEFYRTGLLIAGCAPLWWLVPDALESSYTTFANALREKKYVDEQNIIDYGSAVSIPATEFLSAGIWQLYKGLESSHKAVLKLLLIEVYANEHPKTRTLSQILKEKIYSGECSPDELDPYVQIYRKIESYLVDRNELSRLELVRRCFYYKVGIALSRTTEELRYQPSTPTQKNEASPQAHWRHSLIARLTREWKWSKPYIARLDQRHNWPVEEIKKEQFHLTRELTNSYRLLLTLVRDKSIIDSDATARSQRDLTLLGRKIYAAFEKKASKIIRFNHALTGNLAQETLTLSAKLDDNSNTLWSLSCSKDQKKYGAETETATAFNSTDSATHAEAGIYQASCLVEVITWCVINGLLSASSKIRIADGNHDLSDYEVRTLQTQLSSLFAPSATKISDRAFSKPCVPQSWLLVINPGIDPLKQEKQQGLYLVSDNSNPLAYSAGQTNLIASCTAITVNSWGEVFSHQFSGDDALEHALTQYFSFAKRDENNLPERKVICACPSRATAISEYVCQLFDSIETHFFTGKSNTEHGPRYIYESAKGFHVIEWQDNQPTISLHSNEEKLLDSLHRAEQSMPLVVDGDALKRNALPVVLRTLEARQSARKNPNQCVVSVFYEVVENEAIAYIVDNKHCLSTARLHFGGTRTFIIQLGRFIDHSMNRRRTYTNDTFASEFDGAIDAGQQPSTTLEFYRLSRNSKGYSTTLVPSDANFDAAYLPVQATGSVGLTGSVDWTLHFEGQVFSKANHGDNMYIEFARTVLTHRKSGQERYPCYITDIDLSGPQNLSNSLARDFYYKLELEKLVAEALDTIAS